MKGKIRYLAPVKVSYKLVRMGAINLKWERVRVDKTGVCLGPRTLSDGRMKWNPDVPDEPDKDTDMTRGWFSYVPIIYLHAYLVSLGPNTNPVYVLKDDIEEV